MRNITRALAGLTMLSVVFGSATPANAQDFNDNNRSIISIDMSRVFEPSRYSCSQFTYSYRISADVLIMDLSLRNAYGDELGSDLQTTPGTGSAKLQVCGGQDFTGPLTLTVESIGAARAPTTISEFPFSFLKRQAAVKSKNITCQSNRTGERIKIKGTKCPKGFKKR